MDMAIAKNIIWLHSIKNERMKKQILSTMVLVLALVIAGYKVNAQTSAVHNTNATPIIPGKTNSLEPLAGVPYNYGATVSPRNGTANWFVTTNPVFIDSTGLTTDIETTTGNYVIAAQGLGQTNVASDTTMMIEITWNTIGLSEVDYDPETKKPLFVGIMYDAVTDNCANNIQVWKIEPVNGFTLDITNINADGVSQDYEDLPVEQCFDEVASAIYNFESDSVEMNYGTQTLLYEVIAANFSNEFNAQFQLEGLEDDQVATLYWGYSPETTNKPISGSPDNYDSITAETELTNTSTGVSIYVKAVIENNSYEGIKDQTITLKVDGTAGNNPDVKPDLTEEDAFADAATQIIKKRPSITNPVPANFIGKN